MALGNNRLAIVAGDGDLPRLLAEHCTFTGREYIVILFAGFLPAWVENRPIFKADFEKPSRMFKMLEEGGFGYVTFAGAMQRPQLNWTKFDLKFWRFAPKLIPAIKSGDDVTLRAITAIFEAEGIQIIGAHDVLENLLAPSGIQTVTKMTKVDWADVKRGMDIAQALGRLDVGQGAVVAGGICLGVESIQGTDAMLSFVCQTGEQFRLHPEGAKGVLCKVPKPGQDWRVDLPSIGVATMVSAANAGLAGVAVQAGGVLVLGLEKTVAKADELGLFLVGIDRDEAAFE